jgi:hypothetical protein
VNLLAILVIMQLIDEEKFAIDVVKINLLSVILKAI